MNISEQIINVLDALCEKFGIVVDWSAENVLPYVKELTEKAVNYELFTSIVWLIIGIIFVLSYIKLSIHFYYKWDEFVLNDTEVIPILCWIIGGICATLFSLSILNQVDDIIACLTFPEKVIYDMISQYL